ncbi:MAG: fimbrillin family protein [Prevotellaceae bacterium]|jgi:hypothetical protein|nr:fimbrillin family protein [Prevotellaceae bacterium]
MRKNLLFAAVAALVLGSCASEEIFDPAVLEEEANAIGFGSFLDRTPTASASRSGVKPQSLDLDYDALKTSDGLTVLAYYTGSTDWSAYKSGAPATPNFMNDQQVTWSSQASSWEYSPLKYWPKADDQWGKLSFFATLYHQSVVVDGVANGAPILGFTTPEANAQQIDLVADALYNITKETNSGKVKFTFDHILSKIGFSAKLAGTYAGATVAVKSLRVYYETDKIATSGTYTFSDGENNKTNSPWTKGATYFAKKDIDNSQGDPVFASSATLTTTPSDLSLPSGYLMLIPQTPNASDMYVELNYDITTTLPDLTTSHKARIELPAISGGWLPGKAYTYTFTLSLDPVVFDTETTISVWEEGTNPGDISVP